jgi:hypothetical protein
MLRSLTRTPTEHPTSLRDIDIGFVNMFGVGFDPDAKEEARMESVNRPFTTQDGSGQTFMDDSKVELDMGVGALPWVNGLPGQFYPQDSLRLDGQQITPGIPYGTNTAMLTSNFNWDDPGRFLDRTTATPPFGPERPIRNDDNKRQIFPLPTSTSTSTSASCFTDLSQNKDMFEPSSPSTPNSPSDESESMTGFRSVAVPTIPSSESNPEPSRKLSRVSSVEGDKRALISCSNCSTNNTSLWRRDNDGLPVCNACGLFMRLHGIPRPLSLKTDVVKKRKRDRVSGVGPQGGKTRGTRTRASRTLARVPSRFESEAG